MTDSPLPFPDDDVDERDLLASRAIDGDLGVDELSEVEADAATMARITAMTEARSWLKDVAPVDVSVTDAAVAAALAAVGGPATPVTQMADVVPMRPRRWAGATPWLTTAAAALAIVVGVNVLSDSPNDDQATTEATVDVSETKTAADGAAIEDSAAGGLELAPPESPATEYSTQQAVDNSAQVSVAPNDSGVDTPAADPQVGPMGTERTSGSADKRLVRPSELGSLAFAAMPDVTSVCAPGATVLLPDVRFGETPDTSAEVEIVAIEEAGATTVVAYDLATCQEAARAPLG